MNWIKRFDYKVFLTTLRFSTQSHTNRLMRLVSFSGNGGMIWLALAAVMLFVEELYYLGWQCIIALMITTLFGEGILKRIFRRPRPFITHGPIHLMIPMPSGFSFPSGHTASSVAVATVCWQVGGVFSILVALYATLMGISRVYLKAHYLTDVLIGGVLGYFCGDLTTWFFVKFM
jgi:undecaprenyl-diphosphatase